MARARNIKPSFFQDDKLGELPIYSRMAFIGLWTLADFKGCLEFRPKMLKVQLLPYDECNIEEVVNALEEARFIRYYSVDGKKYIKIVNFEKHQNPHKNERDSGSDIPDFVETPKENNELTKDGTKPDLIGTARADSLLLIPSSLIPDSLIPEKKEGAGNSKSSTPNSIPQSAPTLIPNSETKPTPGEVCRQLVSLQVAHVNPGHPLLTTLLDAGATMEEFTGAAQSAVDNGKGKFAYVLNTVKGQREDAKLAASTIAVGSIKREKPWFITASGVEAKAKELNITINPKDEAFPQLQAKVFRACGITQEIVRKANQDFGAKA